MTFQGEIANKNGDTVYITDGQINNWNSQFIKEYGINSIPRFILINTSGKIVNADIVKPSSAELQVQLDAFFN